MLARLIVEAGLAEPRICDLTPEQTIRLGRSRHNTIVLPLDDHVSRKHAELFRGDGDRWFLRDCKTINGTRLNGRKIDGDTALDHGAVIGIGEARLRFTTRPGDTDPEIPLAPPESDETRFQPDELTALFNFLSDALRQDGTHGLIRLALKVARQQVLASVCGFQGVDGDGLLRVVEPEAGEVDVHLSRTLAARAQAAGLTVRRAGAAGPGGDTDSLDSYRDAVCVPVRGAPDDPPLGALHAYKTGGAFLERHVRFLEVLAGCLASGLRLLRGRSALEADNRRLRRRAALCDRLIGDSAAMRRVRHEVEKLGATHYAVLVRGESGVGKELVAKGLHDASARRDGPLVAVNCAAIPANMHEAHLFGHEKGAFTGADKARPGFFRQADQGTLFLDEVGELSLECQAKLLRALETGEILPVGASEAVTVDVRLVSATNRDLKARAREGEFRDDLLYRLGMELKVPPLRERPEDVPALAAYLLERENVRCRKSVRLSAEAVRLLQGHFWAGNVRELRTVIERALAMGRGDVIEADDLWLRDEPEREKIDAPASLKMADVEVWAIRKALKETNGNKTHAARLLEINRDTLIKKVREYGLKA